MQDAVLRRLQDDDLSVVQAALKLNRLSDLLNSSSLLDALHKVLQRCISNLMTRECAPTCILYPKYLFMCSNLDFFST